MQATTPIAHRAIRTRLVHLPPGHQLQAGAGEPVMVRTTINFCKAGNLKFGQTFRLDDDQAIYALLQYAGISQDGSTRWAVCIASNHKDGDQRLGKVMPVHAAALVRPCAMTQAAHYVEQ